jgi:hypothetical protein
MGAEIAVSAQKVHARNKRAQNIGQYLAIQRSRFYRYTSISVAVQPYHSKSSDLERQPSLFLM